MHARHDSFRSYAYEARGKFYATRPPAARLAPDTVLDALAMDPLTHAVLGASCGAARRRRAVLPAVSVAAVAALVPDLDLLVRSGKDPLLALEFHRHATHSLLLAPLEALVVAAALGLFGYWRRQLAFAPRFAYALAGVVSHLLLDACTSYGTRLWWPLADARPALGIIAVFDPLFTLLAIAGLALVWRRGASRYARIALGASIAYLALGAWQQNRALAAAEALAAQRGHVPRKLEALPALGSVLLWKTLYEHEGRIYVDAVRAGPNARAMPGESIAVLDLPRDFPRLPPDSVQARDIARFARVARGWAARGGPCESCVVDLRYSLVPNEISGFWALAVSSEHPDEHARLVDTREQAPRDARRLLGLLFGAP